MPALEWKENGTACSQTSRHVGKCIYCGSTENLTKEHIVPLALGGRHKLVEGSCEGCAVVTGRVENYVLHRQFLLLRMKLGMPSRHSKEKQPKSFPFVIVKDGQSEVIELPVEDCPIVFGMPEVRRPRCLEKYAYKRGMNVTGWTMHGRRSSIEAVLQKFGADSISIEMKMYGNTIGRMLAKMAYGMAVFVYGPDAFEKCYVLPCILGQKQDTGYWVGISDRHCTSLPSEQVRHRIDMFATQEGEVHARVRLFADFQTPEYEVVVGRLKRG